MSYKHRILIGGIGDDAHSVGIRLLELGFKEAGYYVFNVGIRNELETFFNYAREFDIIMISNKNGHAELFLREFPRLLSNFELENNDPKVWCVGGSLSVGESDFQVKKRYLNMGFSIVHPKPVSFQGVLEEIREQLGKKEIPQRHVSEHHAIDYGVKLNYDEIITRKWTDEELQPMRKEILQEWHTGKDIEQNALSITKECKHKYNLADALLDNKKAGRYPLLQPRTGVACIDQQSSKLKYLEKNGSGVSSVQLDASSRSRMYEKAEQGVQLSKERKSSQLNGFPIPVYGVKKVDEMIRKLNTPFQLRGGGPDHRFTYEIALGAGVSALEGGFICYCLPYDKMTSPIESLRNWQYIDRLCAIYSEKTGIHINREYFGVLTATLIEPSIAIVVNIIQAVMSAQQGVKSITVGYAEQGNRAQDIAAIRAIQELTEFYLKKLGYRCDVTTVFHQYMAAFPADHQKASDLIFNSSITAALSGATKMMVKTPVEAIQIPTRYDNAEALGICKKGFQSSHHTVVDYKAVWDEKRLIEKEVHQIMDAIMEEGNGNLAIGAIKSIENGTLDIPWSPSIFNANKVISVRDINGAVRFYDFGGLPLDQEIKEFHQEKVTIRKLMERDSSIFSLLEKDLSRIWKNDYVKWPLDGSYVN